MDRDTDSQMARYLSLSIMLYCLYAAKLATCTGCGEHRGYPAAPGRLSLEIGVGGLWHQMETGDNEDTSVVLADLRPKHQGNDDLGELDAFKTTAGLMELNEAMCYS